MSKKMVKCTICGAEFEEGTAVCPVCGVGPENFVPVEPDTELKKKNTHENFVIIGGGPAARSAAAAIRDRNCTCSITLITMEDALPYNRPMLTKSLLKDHSGDALAIEPAEWYSKNDIYVVTGTKVTAIDTVAREITMEMADGAKGGMKYDKLIYAPGAFCFVAPIKGSELDHVVTVRNVSDTERIRNLVKSRDAKNIVCIGGGVMGLEGAWNMKEEGFDVTVLETAPALLPRQLDDKAAGLLQRIGEKNGVNIVTGAKITEITEDAVLLEDGRAFPAEIVIMSTGMRPYTQLAEESGIRVDKWVSVDSRMRTSADRVYAAGDCAAVNGQPQAFWAQAEATGKVAGANAAGDPMEYEPIGSALVMHAFGTAVFALGANGKAPDVEYTYEGSLDEEKGTYSGCYFEDGKMTGAMLVGDISAMPGLVKEIGV